MAKHAEMTKQPSQAKRSFGCPGWGNQCKKLRVTKNQDSSRYGNEGTLAHDVAACCLSRNQNALVYRNRLGYVNAFGGVAYDSEPQNAVYVEKIDDEMVSHVQLYLDTCRGIQSRMVNPIVLIEERLDLSWLVPGVFGTGDFIAIEPLNRVEVVDLKYGGGVIVEAGEKIGDNPQLDIYGLGALGRDNEHMVMEVTRTIVQPRAPHPEGSVRSKTFDAQELLRWGLNTLRPAILETEKPDALVIPGEWCRWCPAEGVCPENGQGKVLAMFGSSAAVAGVTPLPKVGTLSPDRLNQILSAGIPEWYKAVEALAYTLLKEGSPEAPTAFKLVNGNLSHRAWADEEIVSIDLRAMLPLDKMYEKPKILSPPKMETALKVHKGMKPKEAAEAIAPLLAKRTPGQPVMAPISDPRPAYVPAKDMFESKDDFDPLA